MLFPVPIAEFHDELTEGWHRPEPATSTASTHPWLEIAARQHRANFDLWHTEDLARSPQVADADLAQIKRTIDRTNQLRNDIVEELDRALLAWLDEQKLPSAHAPLHSETPGLIVDRLSILSLKIFHTREQVLRSDAPTGHTERNRARLAILEEQRADLAACLEDLWQEILDGRRRIKLYRQMKMYNDPSLNPAIYKNNH